jgi:two-component system, NarL family, sensor kinase
MQIQSSEVIVMIIASIIILLVLTGFIVLFLMAYQRRYHKYQQEMNRMKDSYEQEVLRTQLEIREQTLSNISQEIHDNLGQILSLVKMNLNTLLTETEGHSNEMVKDTRELVGKVITDLRDISKSLNADRIVKVGLAEALRNDVELINKGGAYEAVFCLEGEEYRLDRQKEIVLYRIAQEAMNNIIKHAKPRKIKIVLRYFSEKFVMRIEDDGTGFNAGELRESDRQQGSGLKNMANRASIINAVYSITSTINRGTDISITLPVS